MHTKHFRRPGRWETPAAVLVVSRTQGAGSQGLRFFFSAAHLAKEACALGGLLLSRLVHRTPVPLRTLVPPSRAAPPSGSYSLELHAHPCTCVCASTGWASCCSCSQGPSRWAELQSPGHSQAPCPTEPQPHANPQTLPSLFQGHFLHSPRHLGAKERPPPLTSSCSEE